MRHIIIHDAEEGGYWAEVPSLPGCVSEGETIEEVVANIKEAMELYIEGLIEDGQPVPGVRENAGGRTAVRPCN